MLEVHDLHVAYGRVPVLTGMGLSLRAGEYLGVLGPNGMGKTTLMRALMGALPVGRGSIRFEDKPIERLPVHRRAALGIGLVPQGREVFPHLTVFENLRMGLVAAGREDLSVIDDVLSDFPRLKHLLRREGGALSGGEQQLLSLARCLCTRPKVILLDEPTEGIQPSILEEIVATLQRLKAQRGLSMILVEQNLDFVAALSERVLTIQKGRITGSIDPADLKDADVIAHHIGLN